MVSSLTQITAEYIIKENISTENIDHVDDILKEVWLKSTAKVWYVPLRYIFLTDDELRIVCETYRDVDDFNEQLPPNYNFSITMTEAREVTILPHEYDVCIFGNKALQVLLDNNVRVNPGNVINIPVIHNTMFVVNENNTVNIITINLHEDVFDQFKVFNSITKYPPGYFCLCGNNRCSIDEATMKECFFRSELVFRRQWHMSADTNYFINVLRSTVYHEYSFGRITYTVLFIVYSKDIELPPKEENESYHYDFDDCYANTNEEILIKEIGADESTSLHILGQLGENPHSTIICPVCLFNLP